MGKDGKRRELRERLVAVTRRGPVTDWAERLAELMRKADLPTETVAWSGSPEAIALDIVARAASRDKLDRLELIITIEEAKNALLYGGD